jgi:hypothetical protein
VLLVAAAMTGIADAGVISLHLNGVSNNSIMVGDTLTKLEIDELVHGPDATTLRWSSAASSLVGPTAGLVTNPLYQQGSAASNPLYESSGLRMSFGGLSALFTWTDAGPPRLEFAVRFLVSDADDPAAAPLALIIARGVGTATPPPSRPIGGNTSEPWITNTSAIRIGFFPGQAFTLPDGSPMDPGARLVLGEGAEWTGLVIPAPGAAAMLGLGGMAASRRRRPAAV